MKNCDIIKKKLGGKMQVTKINNRRYLGNKYRLLPFINDVISKECGDFESFADIFAGTGAVSSAYTDKILYTNDILYSNYLCHLTWFSDEPFEASKIEKYVSISSCEKYHMTILRFNQYICLNLLQIMHPND